MVTRLETGSGLGSTGRSPVSPPTTGKSGFGPDWLSAVVNKPKSMPGMRVLSDKLSNRPKDITTTDVAIDSPGRTASSTNSADPSLDLASPGTGKSFSGQPPPVPPKGAAKKKSKKETSAYTRGLQKIGPVQAQRDADYSGWMKKKSSNLMTTWKPRLFVLKGRRLAYYYSEDDDQERGLIDISFHRVLPAGNERLTGLHATITGAGSGGSNTPDGDKSNDQVFIFKLVPPRTGLSRAVNFTKPTVHYFAVPNIQTGRLWMAALMKATIDRDDNQPIKSTYQQTTISLTKAKQMRQRPPALMNLDEKAEYGDVDEESNEASSTRQSQPAARSNGLGIIGESDSGVSGMDKLAVAAAEAGNTVVTSSVPVQSA